VPVKRILIGAPTDEVVKPDDLRNPGARGWFVARARRRAL
jgi:hypothetical protein